MTYYVIDPSGTAYGPADERLLHQWAQEGRVLASSTLRDANGQTMMATAIPGLFPGGGGQMGTNPYGPNPYAAPQGPAPASGYYPRPSLAANSNDLVIAWVFAAIGLICAVCVCALIGVLFGIGGVVFAKRAGAGGDNRAQAALVTSYLAIGLSCLMIAISIIGLVGMRQ